MNVKSVWSLNPIGSKSPFDVENLQFGFTTLHARFGS